MATSGTFSFAPKNVDIIAEAYELAGFEDRSAYDSITARRSIDLIFSDWSNWGVNLWTLEEVKTDMVDGTASYTLAAKYFDILEAVMRITSTTPDIDIPMERISIEEYHNLPDKTTTGRPNLYAIQRATAAPIIFMYPVPDDSTYDFRTWTIRYIEDIGTMQQNPDIPRRFLPALIYRLAYELSLKKTVNSTDPEALKALLPEFRARRQELANAAATLFEKAREEDSTAASLFLRPRLR